MFAYFWVGRFGVSVFDRLVEKRREEKVEEMTEDAMFLRKEKEIYDKSYKEGYYDGYDHVMKNKGI